MWGGVTSAKELRAIADVVDKFTIPTVKVTGGQRIDMLGIRKEDLPAVWADLGKAGFVSGHAYAKGLRTVKTCVGSDWCRFGTQDSTGLGIRIEKFMWGWWTPAKVKMAVSGCPRNCAEATCKDVGVVCVDSGYEIHFAGAAGLDIKGTEVLGLVKTEDEALEVIVALVQMYREQARYLERIYKWTKRVGVGRGQAAGARRSREAHGTTSTASSSRRSSRRSIRGRSASPARTSTSSGRWRGRLRGGGGVSDDWIAIGQSPTSRCAARAASPLRTARSASSARRRTRSSRSRITARTEAGRCRQGIVHGAAVTCPLHNWVISLETGKALGADEGVVRTIPVKVEGERLFIALEALDRRMRPDEMEQARVVRTTCPYCGVGCGVLAEVAADGQVSVRGDPDHPANFGRLCSKGSALGRDHRPRRPAAPSGDRRAPRRMGRGARSGRSEILARRSPSTGRTRSPSTCRASCSPRTITSPTS